jgi:hypothetical protein
VPSTRLSSFGEAHVYEATKNVEEEALKIISARGAGITFCGNAPHWVELSLTPSEWHWRRALHLGRR